MTIRGFVALLCLLLASPSIAGTALHRAASRACLTNRATIRQLWERDFFEVPPRIQPVMLAAINGRTRAVVRGLTAMPQADVAKWRQLAFAMAVVFGHSATAAALLDRGASADAPTPMPPQFVYKPSAYSRSAARWLHAPRRQYQASPALGIDVAFSPSVAVFAAINCDDASSLRALLNHGANPNLAYPAFTKMVLPLSIAVIDGDAGLTGILLRRGADPCLVDQAWKRDTVARGQPQTIAGAAVRAGLPLALVGRLACARPGGKACGS